MPPFDPVAANTSVSLIAYTGATSFKPICTLPPTKTNFVSGPGVRGIMTIVRNCLSIFIICTWTIQHLNIPAGPRPTKNTKEWMRSVAQKIWTKAIWIILTMLFLESLLDQALSGCVATKWRLPHMRISRSRQARSGRLFIIVWPIWDILSSISLTFCRSSRPNVFCRGL